MGEHVKIKRLRAEVICDYKFEIRNEIWPKWISGLVRRFVIIKTILIERQKLFNSLNVKFKFCGLPDMIDLRFLAKRSKF